MENVTKMFKDTFGKESIDTQTIHHFSEGLYARQMVIPSGKTAIGHAHVYDHLSILAKGVAIVKTDDTSVEYKAPACMLIKKNVHHAIYAVEDIVWFCIHATDVVEEHEIDEVLISKSSRNGEIDV